MDATSRLEIAWAAGYFDGEGCTTTFIEKSGRPRLSLFVGQTEPTGPARFQKALGGIGALRGPYPPKALRKLPWWSFAITRFEHVQAAVAMMWPWLGGPKRAQASVCLRAVQNYEAEQERVRAERLLKCPKGHDKSAEPVIYGKRRGRHSKCSQCVLDAHKTPYYRNWFREYGKRKRDAGRIRPYRPLRRKESSDG